MTTKSALCCMGLVFYMPAFVHPFLAIPPTSYQRSYGRAQQWSDKIIRHSTTNNKKLDPEKDLGEILKPTATSNINRNRKTSPSSSSSSSFPEDQLSDLSTTPYLEEHDPDADSLGDLPIPTTGISVADEMEKAAKTRFYSEVVQITGLGDGVKAAQILSSSVDGAYEPVRYLIRLTRKIGEIDIDEELDDDETDEEVVRVTTPIENNVVDTVTDNYVMVDVPPYSEKLEQQLRRMMGPNSTLKAILITCRDNIHYDNAPGVFTIRRADLMKWEKAFPDVAVVAYRMDIPRDCRDSVTQRLDGYGPWAMQDSSVEARKNETFTETGIPLTYNEWDPDIAMDILEGRRKPPGEEKGDTAEEGDDDNIIDLNANGEYTPESIRSKEEGKQILALYTPGRTYGSMSYIFPELELCACGYTLPLEDNRKESWGVESVAGPALDARGFVTTNKAGISKQIESGRKLVNEYSDRFRIVLPCRSDPFYLQEDAENRRKTLLEVLAQYEKLGRIYEQLGITGSSELE
ncbi:hypothetical protein IV203_032750 [Nitzschia inconspicua]|uniref:Uncharacterized protein n=1 Tax=Nitzschia inconspicua TaxID=303405 RepID=A0A9K3KLB4_9STRA|nr:hypothetical protein IV203_032750 [Nitzschia inconspicua]